MVGGAASPPLPTPWGLCREGKHDTPKTSRESVELRPTSPRQLAQGCRGCRPRWWERKWEEAGKAAGRRVRSTYPFQDDLLVFEHPITAVHLGRGRQRITALCRSWGDLLFPSDS